MGSDKKLTETQMKDTQQINPSGIFFLQQLKYDKIWYLLTVSFLGRETCGDVNTG